MNDQPNRPKSSIAERSPIIRCFRWLFCARTLGRTGCGIACLATLVFLVVTVLNWRATRDWENYRASAEAKGTRLNWADYIPAAVPPEQNFAMTPFLAPMFDFEPGTQKARNTNAPVFDVQRSKLFTSLPSGGTGAWRKARKTDLLAWEEAFKPWNPNARTQHPEQTAEARRATAQALLQQLEPVTSMLPELREAARRPHSRFNLAYDVEDKFSILLPHLARLKNLSARASLRAACLVAADRPADAMPDVELAFALADKVKTEPILISFLVRAAILGIAIGPVYDGLVDHKWSAPQLQRIQDLASQFDLIPDARHSLAAERSAGISIVELTMRKPELLANLGDVESATKAHAVFSPLCFLPRSWFRREALSYTYAFDTFIFPVFDTRPGLIDPVQAQKAGADLENFLKDRPLLNHRILCGMLIPALTKASQRAAFAQTTVNLLQVACALERCYQAKKAYPETLEALSPDFIAKLPVDVVTGQPLKYRRDGDRFVLYSVGWNLKDDGGAIGYTGKKSDTLSLEEGDWVWKY